MSRTADASAAEQSLVRLLEDPAGVDPYAVYRELRILDPIHWSDWLGAWLVTNYSTVVDVAKDERWSSSPLNETGAATIPYPAKSVDLMNRMVTRLDPPQHTRVRRLATRMFSTRAAEARRESIRRRAEEVVSAAVENGSFDVVGDVAFEFPLYLTCDILGIPIADMHRVHEWSETYVAMLKPRRTEADLRAGDALFEEFATYVNALLDPRRSVGGSDDADDFCRDLLEAERTGEFTNDDLVASYFNIIFASHETTTSLITNGILTLLEHPDQYARIADDPSLVVTATEELLRYSSSATNLVPRFATRSFDLEGRPIEAGQRLFACVSAANRDPAVFDEPERFDILRSPNPHLGFGWGRHLCLGAAFARVQIQEMLATLVHHAPDLALAGTPQRSPSWSMRGLLRCPVASSRFDDGLGR